MTWVIDSMQPQGTKVHIVGHVDGDARPSTIVKTKSGVLRALQRMDDPQAYDVVVRRHGLDDSDYQTFTEIGKRWGRSKQRVHQVYNRAMKHLARQLFKGVGQ